jgi:hypothetical protein
VAKKENWKSTPDAHDFPAAASYLSLVLDKPAVDSVLEDLRRTSVTVYKAKDLLRASTLPALPVENVHVAKDLKKVAARKLLSPVLLVRGHVSSGAPLTIADGYHRICASYHLDENADIPCFIVDLPQA